MAVRMTILWLIVGVPLAWEVARTLQNALKLFH
jgi:hypothetical protein